MPLSAYINGERQIAPLLNSSEWEALRARKPSIELGCCRSRGFMRVSKLGTQHFVHARRSDTCTTAPESAEHLLLKSIILEAVRNAGWDGDVEVCDPKRRMACGRDGHQKQVARCI
jgi:competence CoiA-like predicted nuclease